MKKILGILVIAGSLVACNNSSDGTTVNDTLNTNTTDSANTTVNPPAGTITDSSKLLSDTTKKDTTKR